MTKAQEILESNDKKRIRALLSFNSDDDNEMVIKKFDIWARWYFPKYFESPDAEFHHEININNLKVYRGQIDSFVDAAYRGAGKDMKTKLFIPYCILNDLEHYRKYFKVLSEDGANSTQSVTDIYNILVNERMQELYPEIFEKTVTKREETKNSFTTSTGIKVTADTVGVEQRGANQEQSRPDFIWFNDFETRKTLRSWRETNSIKENMEEARTGLQKGGGCVYTCNYISEQGNVHPLIHEKLSARKVVLVIPIYTEIAGVKKLTWPERYTWDEIKQMQKDDDDFEGERLCKPNASKDVYFDRVKLEAMLTRAIAPIKETGEFKIFKAYRPDHGYGSGHDVAGGLGLDSSTSVVWDFDTVPANVAGTFNSNTIAPESFGSEIYRQGNLFGGCIQAVENNKYDAAILKAKQLGANLYKTEPSQTKLGFRPATTWGWNTNSLSKDRALSAFRLAIEDGLVELNDANLIRECMAFTRNDVIEHENDPRRTTRHFDLVMAAAIGWQMKSIAVPAPKKKNVDSIWNQKTKTNPAE